MAILQSGSSPGLRIKAGNHVIASARSVDIKPVKARFDAFQRIHLAFRKNDDQVTKADDALTKAERKVGERDVDQDESLEAFAVAHVGAGASRKSPLAEYKLGSVSDIQEIAAEREAKALLKMAAKGKKHPDAGVKKAALAMEKAANAVLAAIKPLEGLAEARANAMHARDGRRPAWEKAFATLKRAARSAEDDGATGLFAALFEVKR